MKKRFIRKPNITIDKQNADICIKDLQTSVFIEGNHIFLSNYAQSLIEINLNGIEITTSTVIRDGDELNLRSVKIIFFEKSILLFGEEIEELDGSLLEIEVNEVPFEGYPNYKRSPRIIKKVPIEEVKIARNKGSENDKKTSLLQAIIPPLIMICISVGISILLKRGLYVLMSITGTGMTLVFSVTKYFSDKKESKLKRTQRRDAYWKYLLQKRNQIFHLYETEKEAYAYNYPDCQKIEEMILNSSERIYERNFQDDDFLTVSLGTSYGNCSFGVNLEQDEIPDKVDELEQQAMELKNEYSKIEKPVVVDLKRAHLGLVGEKKLIHDQLKLMIAQITFFQSYHDLEIILISNEIYQNDFSWMKWYPHLKNHSINVICNIDSERKRDQILGSIHQILKSRKTKIEESKKESKFVPHLLFIIDEPKLIMDHSIMEYLDKEGAELGFSIIYTTNIRANLPENIGTIAIYENSTQATLLLEEKEEKNLAFSLKSTQGINLEWMARNLSVLEHLQGISAHIPESITFFEMYKVEHPNQLDVLGRWKKHNAAKSLAVPLGVRAVDDYVNLNLHEKAHGPHGLIAGTTGSGKSEIIQSYILSLAVNFHPYEVAFLLIDYKGGGMANLFKNLPHLLGTITNLDGAQSKRAMASIKSELARRQKIFSSHEVNHINAYGKLFKSGIAKEPLPHLFIISDEFAELKKEQPDFMTELVSAARIGRSLGVHLILATQKPSGVVDDQIWTNSKFKLALMVQNESDSKEILKTPDAANITIPGRAYLQVGNNEIYELFQSAWSGASYVENKEESKTDNRVYLLNDLGQGELLNEDLSDEDDKDKLNMTQLDATVNYMQQMYENQNFIEVKRPWLQPLETQIELPKQIEKFSLPELNVSLGIVDIPEAQAQIEYTVDLKKDGNLIYIASSGYGKSVFLTTLILALAMKNTVKNLNFYILDFGNSGLIPLNALHHTADYITMEDAEKLGKFAKLIDLEINKRKKILASAMVQNFDVYNKTAAEPLKAIVIAMDNYDVVRELGFEIEEFFARISRDGNGLGIYVVVTATRSGALKYATFNNFKNKIAGFIFDESDITTIVGRSEYKQSDIKGRSLIKYKSLISVMQIYTAVKFETEIEYNQGMERVIQSINAKYPQEKAPRIPILPENFMEHQLKEFHVNEPMIALGLDKEDVQVCGFERNMSPFGIIGETAKGKTNILQIILNQIIGTAPIYLFDSKSMDLYKYKGRDDLIYMEQPNQLDEFLSTLQMEISIREQEIQQQLKANPEKNPKELVLLLEPFYIVSDDIDQFIEFTKTKATEINQLLQASQNIGISFIFTGNSAKFKGFDDITRYMKATTEGLLLSSNGTTGIFGILSSREYPAFKDGLLFHSGSYKVLRLPRATE